MAWYDHRQRLKGKGKGKDPFAQHGENSKEFLGKQVFIIVCIFVKVNHNSIISMGRYFILIKVGDDDKGKYDKGSDEPPDDDDEPPDYDDDGSQVFIISFSIINLFYESFL